MGEDLGEGNRAKGVQVSGVHLQGGDQLITALTLALSRWEREKENSLPQAGEMEKKVLSRLREMGEKKKILSLWERI